MKYRVHPGSRRSEPEHADGDGDVLSQRVPHGEASHRAQVAHEINNPLAVILANVEFVASQLEADAPDLAARVRDVREPLVEVREAAERIAAIVQHMTTQTSQVSKTDRPPGGQTDPQRVGEPLTRTARILVVDDETTLLKALRRVLRDYDVVALANARDGLARIAAGETFDLILCDLMMPEVTGVDFYERLASVAPEQAERVVFITGGATTTRTRDFLASTRNRVIQKPLDMEELREVVRGRLAGRCR